MRVIEGSRKKGKKKLCQVALNSRNAPPNEKYIPQLCGRRLLRIVNATTPIGLCVGVEHLQQGWDEEERAAGGGGAEVEGKWWWAANCARQNRVALLY